MTVRHLHHRALAGPTRSRIVELLVAADGPLGIRELAAALGLHANTVREQLDVLVAAGLAERRAGPPAGRGRPSMRYTATDAARGGGGEERAYEELAGVLADELARRPDPAEIAARAGERWGRALAGEPRESTSEPEALRRLLAVLDEAGFAPAAVRSPDEPIGLRRCPFARLAHERGEVVCGVHLGLMRGVLRQLGAPLDAVGLEPFVRPDLCLAHLGARTDA